MAKVDVVDQSRRLVGDKRDLKEEEVSLLKEAAILARDHIGMDCIAIGLVVISHAREDEDHLATAMCVSYPDSLEGSHGAYLRDLVAISVAEWDRKQKEARN